MLPIISQKKKKIKHKNKSICRNILLIKNTPLSFPIGRWFTYYFKVLYILGGFKISTAKFRVKETYEPCYINHLK